MTRKTHYYSCLQKLPARSIGSSSPPGSATSRKRLLKLLETRRKHLVAFHRLLLPGLLPSAKTKRRNDLASLATPSRASSSGAGAGSMAASRALICRFLNLRQAALRGLLLLLHFLLCSFLPFSEPHKRQRLKLVSSRLCPIANSYSDARPEHKNYKRRSA